MNFSISYEKKIFLKFLKIPISIKINLRWQIGQCGFQNGSKEKVSFGKIGVLTFGEHFLELRESSKALLDNWYGGSGNKN